MGMHSPRLLACALGWLRGCCGRREGAHDPLQSGRRRPLTWRATRHMLGARVADEGEMLVSWRAGPPHQRGGAARPAWSRQARTRRAGR